MFPKISVITPSLNQAAYIAACMDSVLGQEYPNLEYIVMDGGSSDGSQEIIGTYAAQLAHYVCKSNDGGQYVAIQKGFERSTGSIMAWLNADDCYAPRAFFAVAEIFERFPEVEWLMGYPSELNESGISFRRTNLPYARWSKYRFLTSDFQFIGQEAVFWRRSLWERSGGCLDTRFQLAADMELWSRFFRHARLYSTTAVLASFRHRQFGQRSKDCRLQYLAECSLVVDRELARLSWSMRLYLGILRYLGYGLGAAYFFDLPVFSFLYKCLYALPPLIGYSFERGEWYMPARLVKHPPIYWRGKQYSWENWGK